jgi:uncharacterized membrane protein YeaQ/YmgE (transglycosylase-associated protein family)
MSFFGLIIQIIAGIIAGHITGRRMRAFSLGPVGNTIAGGVGGLVGAGAIQAMFPGAPGSGFDFGALLSSVIGGGAGGVVVTIFAGLVRNMIESHRRA